MYPSAPTLFPIKEQAFHFQMLIFNASWCIWFPCERAHLLQLLKPLLRTQNVVQPELSVGLVWELHVQMFEVLLFRARFLFSVCSCYVV